MVGAQWEKKLYRKTVLELFNHSCHSLVAACQSYLNFIWKVMANIQRVWGEKWHDLLKNIKEAAGSKRGPWGEMRL